MIALNGASGERSLSVLCIMQARVGSTRFPGKVLAEIEGVPMLTHALRRAKAAQRITHFVLAIPDTHENDVLVPIGEAEGFSVYRGSESDVLARYWWASQLYTDDKIIVRLTADDPLKDPALIDLAVELFVNEWTHPTAASPHYLHLGGPFWPLGLDVEVFSRGALNVAFQDAKSAEDREHVTAFIRDTFGVWTLKDPQERGSMAMRWTVDTPEDLEFVRAVYAKCYAGNPLFGYDDALAARANWSPLNDVPWSIRP